MARKCISYITLAVDDVERASAFWREGMGLAPKKSPPGIAFFDAGSVTLALCSREMAADLTGANASPAGGVLVSWNVDARDAVDDLLRAASEAGAEVSSPALATAWGGYTGFFTDPDGHHWEVVWNPKFEFAG